MSVPTHITIDWLREKGACPAALREFRRVFGRSAEFVPGNVYRWLDEWNDPEGRGGGMLISYFGRAVEVHASRMCREDNWRLPFRFYAAATLCRLARQNLKRKERAA